MVKGKGSEMCFRARARKPRQGKPGLAPLSPAPLPGQGFAPNPTLRRRTIGTTSATRRRATDSDADRASDRWRTRSGRAAGGCIRLYAECLCSHGSHRRVRRGRTAGDDAPCPVRGVVAHRQQHQSARPRLECRNAAAASGSHGCHESSVRAPDAGRNHPSPRRRFRARVRV